MYPYTLKFLKLQHLFHTKKNSCRKTIIYKVIVYKVRKSVTYKLVYKDHLPINSKMISISSCTVELRLYQPVREQVSLPTIYNFSFS